MITVRLEPDLLEWVRERGGAGWVRAMLRVLRGLSQLKGFARYWQRLEHPSRAVPS
jgi:hypothetical protein